MGESAMFSRRFVAVRGPLSVYVSDWVKGRRAKFLCTSSVNCGLHNDGNRALSSVQRELNATLSVMRIGLVFSVPLLGLWTDKTTSLGPQTELCLNGVFGHRDIHEHFRLRTSLVPLTADNFIININRRRPCRPTCNLQTAKS